jgi:hypothetical protein
MQQTKRESTALLIQDISMNFDRMFILKKSRIKGLTN